MVITDCNVHIFILVIIYVIAALARYYITYLADRDDFIQVRVFIASVNSRSREFRMQPYDFSLIHLVRLVISMYSIIEDRRERDATFEISIL